MTREFKEKWIEALLSGDYEQGQGQLVSNGKFCCLAVALDIQDPNRWIKDTSSTLTPNELVCAVV